MSDNGKNIFAWVGGLILIVWGVYFVLSAFGKVLEIPLEVSIILALLFISAGVAFNALQRQETRRGESFHDVKLPSQISVDPSHWVAPDTKQELDPAGLMRDTGGKVDKIAHWDMSAFSNLNPPTDARERNVDPKASYFAPGGPRSFVDPSFVVGFPTPADPDLEMYGDLYYKEYADDYYITANMNHYWWDCMVCGRTNDFERNRDSCPGCGAPHQHKTT